MTRGETEQVQSALDYLNRAMAWLKSDRVAICSVNKYPNSLSYVNKDGVGLDTLNRDCGSDLQLAEHAAAGLRRLLATRGYGAKGSD